MNVLVVDDDTATRHVLQARLENQGLAVKSAPDAMSAIGVLSEFSPDVAVLDVNLPGTDGIELAELLSERGCSARPVFLTASKDPALRRRAEACMPCAFVEKPYDANVLIEKIQQMNEVAHE